MSVANFFLAFKIIKQTLHICNTRSKTKFKSICHKLQGLIMHWFFCTDSLDTDFCPNLSESMCTDSLWMTSNSLCTDSLCIDFCAIAVAGFCSRKGQGKLIHQAVAGFCSVTHFFVHCCGGRCDWSSSQFLGRCHHKRSICYTRRA